MKRRIHQWTYAAAIAAAVSVGGIKSAGVEVDAATDVANEASYRTTVVADWAAQERRRGRTPDSPEAIREALDGANRLLRHLSDSPGVGDLHVHAELLRRLQGEVDRIQSLDEADRLELYHRARSVGRALVFENPLVGSKPVVFMKRRRFISQMLNEYLGYFCDYGDVAGGGIYVLQRPGRSFEMGDLIGSRLPRGNYITLSVSYDAETVYFAFCERAFEKPDYYSADRRCFHIFAVDAGGEDLRQLTTGADDDFDPCPLPDGRLAFMSTRRGGFGRCHGLWEPLPAYTLHRMNADGSGVTTLSYHETNEWHPSVLNDGRIVYTRWDYVDRSAAHFHGLWTTNPDGSNSSILFGNYTQRINACFQPRAIPGSNRVMFVAGAHHAVVGGSLVIVDPARTALDRETGQDRFESIDLVTPEVCLPEAPGWPTSYFHSPWPLSEDCFLVSFSFEPLGGSGSGTKRDTKTGIYYLDRFGNMELFYREEGISCMYPVPLAARPAPPVLPSMLDPGLGEEGELVLADVQQSLLPLPADRDIVALRVFQVLPKTESHVIDKPRIGYARGESARMLLGTVPVEADGSARFRVPAGKPLYFQAVDGSGRAVASMRSVVYVQPGERRGCVGCHEPPGTSPPAGKVLAMNRPASLIEPGPDGTRPFGFPRLVQPVLDRHCVGCHDGSAGPGKSAPALTGKRQGTFSESYENLRSYVRWYEWGNHTIHRIVTRPGHMGADSSPLTKILNDATHAREVHLTDEDRRRLHIWLDGNAPFYGTYSRDEQLAQHSGKAVQPPRVQ